MYETQLDEYSNEEVIDTSIYIHLIVCQNETCSNSRWVKAQDKQQVLYCKPCARAARLKDRAERAKKYRQNAKTNIPE